jgi:hypothetical protein
LNLNQKYAIPTRVKATIIWGRSGLYELAAKEIANSQFYIPPMILTSLIHYAEQQHWQYDNWFTAQNLDLEQIRQGHGFVGFSELCEVIHLAVKDTNNKI